jgi:hypothetical protein
MLKAGLIENIERLMHTREKLAFIYDCFSQTDGFEFSNLGGNFGIAFFSNSKASLNSMYYYI